MTAEGMGWPQWRVGGFAKRGEVRGMVCGGSGGRRWVGVDIWRC